MIPIKTPDELKIMKKAGKIAGFVRRQVMQAAVVGISTLKLDQLAQELMIKKGTSPSFRDYQGFPASIVTCINHEVVHAIPSSRKLKAGDLLTIDLGVYYQGLHVDTAVSFFIDQQGGDLKDFLKTGRVALKKAIQQCRPGKRVGDISWAIQSVIEQAGLSPIRAFVGHGVGKDLHEEPQIPCFGERGSGPLLKPGMTLAVEVMYSAGLGEIKILKDDWTAVTADGSLSAMFEHTVAITKSDPLILTR